jgi:hypothetical protein
MKTTLVSAAFVFAITGLASAQNPIFVTPEEARAAGPDFDLQGEYAGQPDGTRAIGVQIIALGDSNFRWVEYAGGLPGAGAEGKGVAGPEAKANAQQVVEFKRADGSLARLGKDGIAIGKQAILKKIERKSPTLGKTPPAGATVLFDGGKPDAWDNGRVTPDGLLMEGVTSKQRFGDHTLHLEFRTSFKPSARGQDRGNSGLYMQGRYETQILDSFGLEGKMDETGGIYSVKEPRENLCFPPLAWQTYDIEFTAARFDPDGKKTANARMTVLLNGVKVQDDVEVPHATTASPFPEGPDDGPIFLQDHGNAARYRNIWLKSRE